MINFNTLDQPYFIAEIGINHNGDMQIAKRLIDSVFATGWHCAKFQKRNPHVAVPKDQKTIMRETPWGKMTYLDYKLRIEFEQHEYDMIHSYCQAKPLDWSLSVWDLDSLEFACQYELPFIKIPSAMLTNNELVQKTCQSGNAVVLSTGMSTLEEIDNAVNLLTKHAKSFAILHCNSSYPANENELNLKVIPTFKERYQCPIGYSGHEYSIEPSTMAYLLGAKIIERHVTLDHKMWGTDQEASLEISGMHILKSRIQSIDNCLGDGVKTLYQSEISVRKKLRGN